MSARETFGVEQPQSKTSLLDKSNDMSRSFAHGLRPTSQSAATTYGAVHSSMPVRRPRSHTHHHRHRPHAFSIDIQDPRERRMSRSRSEMRLQRGLPGRSTSYRSVGARHATSSQRSLMMNAPSEKDEEMAPSEFAGMEEGSEDGDGSEEEEPVLSRFSIFALTINFIIGVGVLDLPYIFSQSGILLCVVFVVFSTLGSFLAGNYVLESQSRGIMRSKVSTTCCGCRFVARAIIATYRATTSNSQPLLSFRVLLKSSLGISLKVQPRTHSNIGSNWSFRRCVKFLLLLGSSMCTWSSSTFFKRRPCGAMPPCFPKRERPSFPPLSIPATEPRPTPRALVTTSTPNATHYTTSFSPFLPSWKL